MCRQFRLSFVVDLLTKDSSVPGAVVLYGVYAAHMICFPSDGSGMMHAARL